MRRLFMILIGAIVPFLGGCAVHPLPDNYTGIPTDLIVAKIRCEAGEALKDNLVQYLLSLQNDDPDAYRIGVQFQDGRSLTTFSDKQFKGTTRTIVDKFVNSAIAYDFTFDMTEVNNLDATVDILKPIPVMNAFTAAFTGGVDRTRENMRIFTVTDTFVGLFTKVEDGYCARFPATGPNYMYPIVGRIGMGEMIHNFVDLALFENLSADPTKAGAPPTTADTLTFTTKLAGSVAPKIVLAPLGTALQVADASLIGSVSRTDVHKLIVGLALPPPAKPKTKASSTSTTAAPGIFVTAIGTPAEILAANAVSQVLFRESIRRSNLIVVTQ